MCTTSLRLRHTWSRQPYGRKFPCVLSEIPIRDSGSHLVLQIGTSDCDNDVIMLVTVPMITRPRVCFRHSVLLLDLLVLGNAVRHCATSQEVAGSIPD
jgi:hypothetical protein